VEFPWYLRERTKDDDDEDDSEVRVAEQSLQAECVWWVWSDLGISFATGRSNRISAARRYRLLLRLGCSSRDPIEHDLGIWMILGPRPRAKVKPNILPGITRFALQSDGR
jgi:hypothetical protein